MANSDGSLGSEHEEVDQEERQEEHQEGDQEEHKEEHKESDQEEDKGIDEEVGSRQEEGSLENAVGLENNPVGEPHKSTEEVESLVEAKADAAAGKKGGLGLVSEKSRLAAAPGRPVQVGFVTGLEATPAGRPGLPLELDSAQAKTSAKISTGTSSLATSSAGSLPGSLQGSLPGSLPGSLGSLPGSSVRNNVILAPGLGWELSEDDGPPLPLSAAERESKLAPDARPPDARPPDAHSTAVSVAPPPTEATSEAVSEAVSEADSPADPPNSAAPEEVLVPEAFLVADTRRPMRSVLAVHAEPLQEQPALPWWKQRQAKFLLSGALVALAALAIVLAVLFSSGNDPPTSQLSPPGQSTPLASFFPTPSDSPSTAPSLSPSFTSLPSMQPSVSIVKGTTLEEWQGGIRDNDPPNSTSTLLTGLQISNDRRDPFGVRLRSLIVPPQSGVYYFYLAAAGSCELFLSCGRQEADKNLIASTSLTPPPVQYKWDRYSTQRSDPLILQKDRAYYIEASYDYTDITFANHLEVGWESPQNSIPLTVINGSYTFLRYLPHDSDPLSSEPAENCFPSLASSFYCSLDTIGEEIVSSDVASSAAGFSLVVELNKTNQTNSLYRRENSKATLIGTNNANLTSSNSLLFRGGNTCGEKQESGFFRIVVDSSLSEVTMSVTRPALCYYEFRIHTPNCTILTDLVIASASPSYSPSSSFVPSTTPTLALSSSPSFSFLPSGLPSFSPSFMPSISSAPSAYPSITSAPSMSSAPSETCYNINIFILPDYFPEELSWEVFFLGPNHTLHEDKTSLIQSTSKNQNICLSKGQYEFIIYDSGNDGICCSYGNGSYNLSFEQLLFASGGEFQASESVLFTVPVLPSPTSHPTTSLAPSTTLRPSQLATTTFGPSSSLAPSMACYTIDIDIFFDDLPFETSWEIIQIFSSPHSEEEEEEILISSYSGAEVYYDNDIDPTAFFQDDDVDWVNKISLPYQTNECLTEGRYKFVIRDFFGDGMCCCCGDGYYSVTYENMVIVQGGEFSDVEVTFFDIPFTNPEVPSVSLSS